MNKNRLAILDSIQIRSLHPNAFVPSGFYISVPSSATQVRLPAQNPRMAIHLFDNVLDAQPLRIQLHFLAIF